MSLTYRADIDGIRALAVGVVVLFHAGVPGFSGGFIGVDVFFVLSGFLITSIITRKMEAGTFGFKDFFLRRAKRLFPALYAMLTVTTGAAVLILTPGALSDYAKTLAATVLYGSNILYWRTSGYFDGPSDAKPLLHTWSLSVEEQFYLVTPILLFGIHRWLGSRFALVLTPIAAGSLAFSTWGVENMPTSTFFLLPSRFWELLAGSLLAVGAVPAVRNTVLRESLALAALVAIGLATFFYDDLTPFPGAAALVPVLSTMALLHTGAAGPTRVSGWLSSRPLVALGLVSYSFYLWHWPFLVLGRHIALRELHLYESSTLVVASLAAAWLSYRFVEQPFRFSVESDARTTFIAMAPAAVALLVTFGILQSDGLAFRFPAYDPTPIARSEGSGCALGRASKPDSWNREACTLSSGSQNRVLLWGDSLAGHYDQGIRSPSNQTDATYMLYTLSECLPAFGYSYPTRPTCQAVNDHAWTLIERERIDTVVLAARWELAVKRRDFAAFEKVQATIRRLVDNNIDVVVIGQSPILPTDPRDLRLRYGAGPTARTTTHTERATEVNDLLRSYTSGAEFVDPNTVFCQGLECSFWKNGHLFADDVHLTRDGSIFAAGAYLPFIRVRAR